MKSLLVALVAIFFSTASFAETKFEAPEGLYKIDPTHASLTWKINHMGLSNYTARFTKFDASLAFRPDAIETSKLEVTIDPLSVETDYPKPEEKDFNKKISTHEELLNAGKFPDIVFTSTSVEKTGDMTGKVTGDLTMLGVTKPVTLDVTFNGSMKEHPFTKQGALGFSATGTLKRSEWGMDYGTPNVGDEVQLIIEAEFLEEK